MMRKSPSSKLRGRPPKSLRQDGKLMIVDAALDLFSSHGYSGTSLKMIGDQIGFKPNALYAHFKSKEDLKDYILKKYGLPAVHMEVDKSVLIALLSEPEGTLKLLLNQFASQWLSPKELKVFRFLLVENLRGEADEALQIQKMGENLRKKFFMLMSGLIQFGKVKSLDPEWLCSQFFGPIMALRMELALSAEPMPLAQVQNKLSRHVEMFFAVFGENALNEI